jgi:hypothetical protein
MTLKRLAATAPIADLAREARDALMTDDSNDL